MASDAAGLGETCACNIQHDQQDTGTAAEHLLNDASEMRAPILCFGRVLCMFIPALFLWR